VEKTNQQPIRGLNIIRFFSAVWVVMSHCGTPPLITGIDRSQPAGFVVNAIYANLFSGSAAVIVFFVISGLCIHYPQVNNLKISNLPGYFLRRYLRVGIPLIVAIYASQFVNINLTLFSDSILWSLFAELIYYTIYPVLLKIRQQGFSWRKMFAVSFVIGLCVAATNPLGEGYPIFGVGLNWLLGLPCWLLGVQLAEVVKNDIAPKPKHIWRWRIVVWGTTSVCSVLRFHSPIGYQWSLNFFAILVCFWLLQEIRFYRYETPSKLLEWAGTWSYSIYLVHQISQAVYNLGPRINLGYLLNWSMSMSFILITSYAFAFLFEFPSHKLAGNISRKINSRYNTNSTSSEVEVESMKS
jgi:peptidoglycan/LPS O-acetylase OafA/YrhL